MSKFLYIPIEIKKREYPAKIFLAMEACTRGYHVVVGRSTYLEKLMRFMPKGVYLGTSIVKQHQKIFSNLKSKGHLVAAVDEEGLVYYNKDNFVKFRVDGKAIDAIDAFLAWGQHHFDLVMENSKHKNVFITGNVRFELLKKEYNYLFEKEAKELREKYGQYVLINTNLAAFNHFSGEKVYFSALKSLVNLENQDETFYKMKMEHQETILNAYMNLIDLLSKKYENINFIVRPHPSENIVTWSKLERENVFIIQEGNVIPWIISAECVIQQNCTTAIEAHYLGTNTLSYLPCYDEAFDSGLPNQISKKCYNETEVIMNLEKILDNKNVYSKDEQEAIISNLNYYISNMGIQDNSFQEIINVIDKIAIETSDKLNTITSRLYFGIREPISLLLNSQKRRNIKYQKQKLDYISKKELTELIENSKFKFSDIKIKRICKDVYKFYIE